MPRILIRSHKAPFTIADAETTYDKNLIGNNTGNLVFSQSVYRLLSTADAELSTSGLAKSKAKSINGSYDHVVIPLANAFRPGYEPTLDALSTLIEELTVPVTVVGVGAQASIEGAYKDAESVGAATSRFVRAVLDRSPSIGVRGEFTAEFLSELGFGDEHVRVIGCPSMFMYGPDFQVHKKVDALTQDSPIALNISPYVREMGPISLYGAEHYPNLLYMAQNIQTLELMLHGTYPMGKKGTMLRTGVPVTLEHPLIRQNRVRFFLDPKAWFAHLANYDFSFGTRIHGNIAALLAGTPALLLAHDSRTLELAHYHEIPHREIGSLPADADPAALYPDCDWEPMNTGHPLRWDRFASFLTEHQLDHVYGEGGDRGQAFDERLAATDLPGPVETLMGLGPEELYAMKRALIDLGAEFETTVAELTAARAQPAEPLPPKSKKTPKPPAKLPVRVWNKITRTFRRTIKS